MFLAISNMCVLLDTISTRILLLISQKLWKNSTPPTFSLFICCFSCLNMSVLLRKQSSVLITVSHLISTKSIYLHLKFGLEPFLYTSSKLAFSFSVQNRNCLFKHFGVFLNLPCFKWFKVDFWLVLDGHAVVPSSGPAVTTSEQELRWLVGPGRVWKGETSRYFWKII